MLIFNEEVMSVTLSFLHMDGVPVLNSMNFLYSNVVPARSCLFLQTLSTDPVCIRVFMCYAGIVFSCKCDTYLSISGSENRGVT